MDTDLLLQIQKPGRYIGKEWNVSTKNFDASALRIALCFPDLYEVGMSNLGVRILYGLLNAIPDVCCERAFSPAADMEALLRAHNKPLFSLESQRPLHGFDIVGFSLGYELCYTNVLQILDLSGIPLLANDRDARWPLVIAGGPCVINPEPVHAFFDLFVVGEAEEAIVELTDLLRREKARLACGAVSKEEFLLQCAGIEGVYVPRFYEPVYDAMGDFQELLPKRAGVPRRIRKRIVKDFEHSFFPLSWLVPYLQIVHDRPALEIMRGCPNRCRFCQARALYYPYRLRSIDRLMSQAHEIYRCSGYEELSLLGLSVSDYPAIEKLLARLMGEFGAEKVGISLPSIRANLLVGELAALIASIKKTGLTFAPEVASARLRRMIDKDFDEAQFTQVLEQSFTAGYQHVKLYFLMGLPQESSEDLQAIADFCFRVSAVRKRVAASYAQVNVSINTLVPKAHTPFQWCAMDTPETALQKREYLRSRMRPKWIKSSFQNPFMGRLEGVFSRGDRRLSEVIMLAYRAGARFDGWQDSFNEERWQEAFRVAGLDPQHYIKERPLSQPLAWDFIDIGIDPELVKQEYNKMIA